MKTPERLASIAIALACFFLLSGCNDSNQNGRAESRAKEPEGEKAGPFQREHRENAPGKDKSGEETFLPATYGQTIGDGVVKLQYLEAFLPSRGSTAVMLRVWADSDRSLTLTTVLISDWKTPTFSVYELEKPRLLKKDARETVTLLMLGCPPRHQRVGQLVKIKLRLRDEATERRFQLTIPSDEEIIQGEWTLVARQVQGADAPVQGQAKVVYVGNGLMQEGDKEVAAIYKLKPDAYPKQVDVSPIRGPFKGVTLKGIYELEADLLLLCLPINPASKERPSSFETRSGDGHISEVFQRQVQSGSPAQPATVTGGVRQKVGSSPVAQSADYFPMETGCHWRYSIELGETDALHYGAQQWPLGNQLAIYESRGRYLRPEGAAAKQKKFALEFRVKQKVEQQGRLKYPHGVELEIIEDEIGMFGLARDVKRVLWAFGQGSRVTEVRVLDGLRSPVSGAVGIGQDGWEEHLVFFGDGPGTRIAPRPHPNRKGADALMCEEVGSKATMRFVRTVDPPAEKESPADVGFRETLLYEKGRGLVSLVQEIDGKTSMTWTLEEFKKD